MRRTLLVGIGLTTVIVTTAGWQLTHRTSGGQPTAAETSTVGTSPGSSTPPSETVATTTAIAANDVSPVAVEPSEATAVRAAVRFLETDENLFPRATPAEARSISDSIASSAARTRLGDRAEQHQTEALAKGDLEGLVLRIAPVTTRVRKYTNQSATVDIFFLKLWSFPTKGALDDYATAQLDLVWENNSWRLDDSSVIDGPYPIARFSTRPIVASSAARFESTLAGFDDEGLTP
jgi:hypothetical protein